MANYQKQNRCVDCGTLFYSEGFAELCDGCSCSGDSVKNKMNNQKQQALDALEQIAIVGDGHDEHFDTIKQFIESVDSVDLHELINKQIKITLSWYDQNYANDFRKGLNWVKDNVPRTFNTSRGECDDENDCTLCSETIRLNNRISELRKHLESERAAHAETKQRLAEYEHEQLPTKNEAQKMFLTELSLIMDPPKSELKNNDDERTVKIDISAAHDIEHNKFVIGNLEFPYATTREVQPGDILVHWNDDPGDKNVSIHPLKYEWDHAETTPYRLSSSGKIVPIENNGKTE